jgi:hypothetical protein
VLKLERRVSHEGMVSIGGNLYSVPDTTRRRILDVHVLADAIQIFEDGMLVATHIPLEGRDQKRLDPAHRKIVTLRQKRRRDDEHSVVQRTGDQVTRRSLDVYDAIERADKRFLDHVFCVVVIGEDTASNTLKVLIVTAISIRDAAASPLRARSTRSLSGMHQQAGE